MRAAPHRTAPTGRTYTIAALALLGFLPAAIWFGLWIVSFAESNASVLLPTDLAFATPGSDVPAGSAAFAGMWAGDRWDGAVPHALAVERVGADGTAELVHALGADKPAQRIHSFLRRTGKIAGGHLGLTLPDGSEII